MTIKKSERNSNFELMRIISMLFVVIYHVRMHSGFGTRATGTVDLILDFITNIIVVHVNSFVLLSGYFQSKSKMKFSKVIKLNNATWFYKVLFLIIALVLVNNFGIRVDGNFEKINILKTLSPLDHGIYWFIDCYLVLYLISPLLNKLIANLTKKEFERALLLLFVLFSIIPILTVEEVIYTRSGHSVTTFILLYFIGAYLRIYPIEKNYYFKRMSKRLRQTIYLLIMITIPIITLSGRLIAEKISGYGVVPAQLSQILLTNYLGFGSPLLIIQTVAYLLLFESFSINNKIINKLSQYTFGVYLVHENIFVRENLYRYIGFTKIDNITLKTIVLMLITAIIIYIISTLIEALRQLLFKFIYDRKLSKRIRDVSTQYIKDIGLIENNKNEGVN